MPPPRREPVDWCVGPVEPPEAFRERVSERLRHMTWRSYPVPPTKAVLTAVAGWFGAEPDEVLVTRGALEGLRLTFATLLDAGHELSLPTPSFIGFAEVMRALGTPSRTYPVRELTDRTVPPRELFGAGPQVAPVICTPNNPTGHTLTWPALVATVRALDHRPVVVDVTYDPFSDVPLFPRAAALARMGAVVVMSLSKALCLAGARLGVLLAAPAFLARVKRRTDRFHLDHFQTALLHELATVDVPGTLSEIRDLTRSLRAGIVEELTHGLPHLRHVASAGNFVTVETAPSFPCACCGWVRDELECRHLSALGLLRLTASQWNLGTLRARARAS